MKKNTSLLLLLAFSFCLLATPFAEARVGGGRSSGSRGSRGSSSSSPYRSSQGSSGSSTPYRSAPTSPSAPQQPAGGGFMRSLGAGLLGGAIGSMLFGGMRGGGYGGGGGFGMLEILLLAGVAFMAFRFFKSRQQSVSDGGPQYSQTPFSIPPTYPQAPAQVMDTSGSPTDALIASDPQFDLTKFNADRLDDFFRLQAAWANRDLAPLQPKLTDEMFGILDGHLQELKQRGQINKLDNIAVRSTELIDGWQEPGRVFATVLLTANLVDYTLTEATGEVVSGSKTEPVKFSEAWTFVRETGFTAANKSWRLSAIEQTEA